MAAVPDLEAAQQNVAALPQSDRLVPLAGAAVRYTGSPFEVSAKRSKPGFSPLPSMRPGPRIATSSSPMPQIRLFFQWL